MIDFEHAQSFSFDTLRSRVRSSDGPVLVDFWEPRCAACRATLDAVDALACRVGEHGDVGTFNVHENPEAARSLGVRSVPTLVVFQDGSVDAVLEGAERIQTFLERIDEEVFFGHPPTCES
jgi:thioredoxin 1